jgi:23S rRNA-intervening sequence protein
MSGIVLPPKSTLHSAEQNPDKRSPQIFSDSYSLCLQVFHYAKLFAKPYRPTLGRRLEETSLDVVLNIKRSLFMTAGPEKAKCFAEVSQILNETRTLFDLSRDIGLLTPAAYQELSDLGLRIGKGLGGLLKHHQHRPAHGQAHSK